MNVIALCFGPNVLVRHCFLSLTIFCLLLHKILKTETEIEETQSFAAASLVSVHFVPSV